MRSAPPRRPSIRAVALGVVAAALLVGLAAAGLWWSRCMLRPLGSEPRTYRVERGSSTTRILDDLDAQGILPSALAARIYIELAGGGRQPRWGTYEFEPQSRGVDVVDRILRGAVETIEVTIVEGLTASEIGSELGRHGISGAERWPDIVATTDWIADLAPEASSLEGFLFPETYRFAAGIDAATVARTMVDHFRSAWRQEAAAAPPRWSVFDTVILASLVEGETGHDDERARVAGVYLNRLDRGMLLQCDPTVVYALKQRGQWNGRLLRRDLGLDDAYNTYRYPGLPPGPIGNPGREALRAALRPESHRYLYFVLQPEGHHAFSRTLAEHNRAVARLRRSRR